MKRAAELLIIVFLLATVSAGCASGPPKPGRVLRQAEKAYQTGDYQTTLTCFEKVIDTTPWILQRSRYEDSLVHYEDAQIQFGLAKAKQAELAGNLIEAWVWLVQISLVNETREECIAAEKDALRIKVAISDDFLKQAEEKSSSGKGCDAAILALQSLWYQQNDPAQSLLKKEIPSMESQAALWAIDAISASDITNFVRTDTITRLGEAPEFAPFGIPIYFGDVPRYYITLGTVEVEGIPISKNVPIEYRKKDVLAKLTAKARKRFDPDALIKVHYWTKSKKAFTNGEAVKFIDYPE